MTKSRQAAGHPEHLLLISGGLDSTWCLKQLLESGTPVRTHHVILRDWEGRAALEGVAVKRVLQWARANGLAHLITHSQSAVDFGSIRWIPKNFHLWAYWAGVILANPASRGIDKIVLPRHSDAFTSLAGAQASDAAYCAHVQAITGRIPKLVFPMMHLSKSEVVRSLPVELRERCWWCRRPKRGQACHKCMTCQQVDAALKEDAVDPNAKRASEQAAQRQPRPAETPAAKPTEQPGNDQVVELGGGWFVWRGKKYHGRAALEAAQAKGG